MVSCVCMFAICNLENTDLRQSESSQSPQKRANSKKVSLPCTTIALRNQDYYGNASWIPSPNNQDMPAKFHFQNQFTGNGA